jgi:hypothetical protein
MHFLLVYVYFCGCSDFLSDQRTFHSWGSRSETFWFSCAARSHAGKSLCNLWTLCCIYCRFDCRGELTSSGNSNSVSRRKSSRRLCTWTLPRWLHRIVWNFDFWSRPRNFSTIRRRFSCEFSIQKQKKTPNYTRNKWQVLSVHVHGTNVSITPLWLCRSRLGRFQGGDKEICLNSNAQTWHDGTNSFCILFRDRKRHMWTVLRCLILRGTSLGAWGGSTCAGKV